MSRSRILRGAVLAIAAGVGLAMVPAGAQAVEPEGPPLAQRLAAKVTVDAMNRHLIAFQRISDRNGGRRAPGTPGHEASVDYVLGKLTAAGFDVTTQQFPVPYSEALVEKLVVGGTNVKMHMALYTPNTPVGGITGPLAVVPDNAAPGCAAADFAGADYTGTIALIRRGGCPFAQKQQNAAKAGAIGVVFANNVDGWLRGNLTSPDQALIPSGGVSLVDGLALREKAGQSVTLELKVLNEQRTSRTVIAQTKTGRTDNVVVAGGHLDSVVEGAGINSNGTGSAALLETALQLGASPKVNNAVRFIFFGAWEFGIIGSPYYVANLTFEQQLDIAMYLNFDAIASPNAGYFVYDGDTGPYGSGHIKKSFVDYLTARGVPTEPIALNQRSDQLAFLGVGIPTGGIHTGLTGAKSAAQAAKWGGTAGVWFDACYHEACDNLGNIDRVALDRNADAMAWVTASYAISTEGVNGVPPRAERAKVRSLSRAAAVTAADSI
ncbi:M28 family peptidase [Actinokineospora sp. HUAS TT18]|uniref:M28 family peptidase n=1 Tax=Actinokineospora sp. HUAS TT18 TaxID=3447451 RepID=UPI003F51BDE9